MIIITLLYDNKKRVGFNVWDNATGDTLLEVNSDCFAFEELHKEDYEYEEE